MNMSMKNPGLEKFELSDYSGLSGKNFYSMLPNLREYVKDSVPAGDFQAVDRHLEGFGDLVATELNDLVIASHQEGKYGELEKFDRHGNRVDNIRYSPEQVRAKKLAFDYGIVNLDQQKDWNRPFHFAHRGALAYISNLNGEAGYNCPLAMTEGMIEILTHVGSEEQKKKFLPRVASTEPDDYFAAGQYLTERVGGSNVGANRTIAKKGENGKWYLTGEKWFCSNPSELWVTTAKIEGTGMIGAFIVPRYKDDKTLNDHHILRLKNIIGSRGKATAEVEYRNTEAELLGRPHTGLALLIRHVINVSRVHAALAASAMARRSFWEAREYARNREAFQKKINEFPSIQRALAEMQVKVYAIEQCIFYSWSLKGNTSGLFDLVTPLMKYIATSRSSEISHSAIMIHGGNGILHDYSVLPRLHNDCIINETWEGTHNIIANHVYKAFKKKKIREAFFEMISSTCDEMKGNSATAECHSFTRQKLEELEKIRVDELSEANRLPLADLIFHCLAGARVLIEASKRSDAELLIARALPTVLEHHTSSFLENPVLLEHEKVMKIINYGS